MPEERKKRTVMVYSRSHGPEREQQCLMLSCVRTVKGLAATSATAVLVDVITVRVSEDEDLRDALEAGGV
jgi:hypothetical protein